MRPRLFRARGTFGEGWRRMRFAPALRGRARSCALHCVVFAGLAAKRPIDRCTTGSRLSRFAHSASPEALKPPSLSTRRRASTDFPPRSRADALPRQTAIKGCAAPPRPFRDSDPEIAAVSATFTDTHPKHSSIRFEKAAFMTIRSKTISKRIPKRSNRAISACSAARQGRTQEIPNLHFPRVREDGLRAAWRN